MTDLDFPGNLPLPVWLKREWFYLATVSQVAKAVASNFVWLDLNQAEPLLMLDFDVICRGLPSFTAQSVAATDGSLSDDEIFDAMAGQENIRHLLTNLRQFSLPPGTLAEAAHRAKLVRGKTSQEIEEFMGRLEHAKKAGNPALVICPTCNTKDLAELVWQEIYEIASKMDDLQLLQNLQTASISHEKLSGQEAVPETLLMFQIARGMLNPSRPDFPHNNFNDAVNAATVMQVFHAANTGRPGRRVPFFVSGTHLIIAIEPSWLRLPKHEIPPNLFNDQLYLAISQTLCLRNNSRCRAVADEASILFRHADEVMTLCHDLIHMLHMDQEAGKTEEHTIRDDIFRAKWVQLMHRRQQFNKSWRSILAPNVRALDAERVSFINHVISSGARRALDSGRPAQIKFGLDKVIHKLIQERHPDYDLLGLEVATLIDLKSATGIEQQVSVLYRISKVAYGEPLLAKTWPEPPLRESIRPELERGDSIALAVHPVAVAGIAILLLEISNESFRQSRATLRWTHRLPFDSLWNACLGSLVRASAPSSERQLTYSIIGLGQPVGATVPFEQFAEEREPLLQFANAIQSLEMKSSVSRVVADVAARDDLERQVSVECPLGTLTRPDSWLVPFMAETMEDRPYPAICRSLLDRLLKCLQ